MMRPFLRFLHSSKDFAPMGMALFCGVLTYLVFAPGILTFDSSWQLWEAQRMELSKTGNHHPMLMSLLLRVFQNFWFTQGTQGLFIFHLALFWLGLGCLAYSPHGRPLQSWGVVMMGFIPPLFFLLPVICKDTALGSALLLGVGASYRARYSRSQSLAVLAGLALVYAAMVRHNGFFAVFPLVIYWAGRSKWGASRFRAFALGGGVVGLLYLIQMGLNFGVALKGPAVDPSGHQIHLQYSQVFDLGGASVQAGENLFPQEMSGALGISLSELQDRYTPASGDSLYWSYLWTQNQGPFSVEMEQKLSQAWMAMLLKHPGPYLKHRFAVTRLALGLGSRGPMRGIAGVYSWRGNDPAAMAPVRNPPLESKRWTEIERRLLPLARLGVFSPWIAILGLLLVLAKGWIWRGGPGLDPLAQAVAWSGLLYWLPYSVIGQASDFRYSWWTWISMGICLILELRSQRESSALRRQVRSPAG